MTTTTARGRCGAKWLPTANGVLPLTCVVFAGVMAVTGCARIEAAPLPAAENHASLTSVRPVVDSTPGTFDAVMAQRGLARFTTSCAQCHAKPGKGKSQRVGLPFKRLRDLWRHPPYFTDGSAPTLAAVVDHYDELLNLNLSKSQQDDLIEYLKSR